MKEVILKLLKLLEKALNIVVAVFAACFLLLIATAPIYLTFYAEGVRAFIDCLQNAYGERIFRNIAALFFGLLGVKSLVDVRHHRTYDDRPIAVALLVCAACGIATCIHFILF